MARSRTTGSPRRLARGGATRHTPLAEAHRLSLGQLAGESFMSLPLPLQEAPCSPIDCADSPPHRLHPPTSFTEWLNRAVALDDKGFVRTGTSAVSDDPASSHALSQPLATSCAGVFAVGDVRSGSIKRVASAVGEGAIVVASVHQALAVL